jgi:hypothetical protein
MGTGTRNFTLEAWISFLAKRAQRMKRRDTMRRRLSSRFVVRLVAMLALVGTCAMPGCSADDDERRNVNVRALDITDTTAAALGGEDFPFANGVRPFGTARTSTAVEFTNDATGANITAGDFTASTSMEYGSNSCTFMVTESEFEPSHPLAPGSRVTILCTLTITAVGVPVGGDPVVGVAILTLGRAMSGAIDIAVRLDDDGSLFVNGVDIGIVITGSEGNTEN